MSATKIAGVQPSISGSDGVITMCVLATLANIYGAVRANKTVTIPIFGGFVVTTILLVVSRPVPKLAEMFAGAFFITSMLTNGAPVLDTVNELVGQSAQAVKPANSTKSQTGSVAPGLTPATPNNNPGANHLGSRPV